MKTRKQYLDKRNRKIQKLYRQLRQQGFTAKKCFEEISRLTEGELSPASIKRIVYTYIPLADKSE